MEYKVGVRVAWSTKFSKTYDAIWQQVKDASGEHFIPGCGPGTAQCCSLNVWRKQEDQ